MSSTVTRVVEGLVKKGYVHREEDAKDRRVRRVGLTGEGQAVFETCWNNVMRSEKAILEQFPVEHRAMLIEFLQRLNQAATCWQAGK
ncbi:MAG: MarR family winged helix-turn-helix transcriptional regulator [bacterium]|nr:MarR family winged helix-turn-helix transcriptional regulator [bacterium]